MMEETAQQKVALALEGGGLRSVGVDAGLTAGLLAACGMPSLKASKLFDRFGTLSTVSGGSWFLASLIYSHSFIETLEMIGNDPESAGSLFHQRWTSKLLAIGAGANPGVKAVEGCLAAFPCHCMVDKPLALLQDIILLIYEHETGNTWQNFVKALLRETAGIEPELQLGWTDVNAWSLNKVWLCNHSIVAPHLPNQTFFWKKRYGLGHAAYNFKPSQDVAIPPYVPATCSVKLGAGTSSEAPKSYVSTETPFLLGEMNYSAIAPGGGLLSCCSAMTLAQHATLSFSLFEQGAGKLPVVDCVASSSAALGVEEAYVPGELNNIIEHLPIWHDAHVWVASAACEASEIFSEGSAVVSAVAKGGAVSAQSLELLALKGVYDTCDAAAVDNTGIALAVASGAREVVAVLNNPDATQLLNLFSEETLIPVKLSVKNPYRIFSSPSVEDVKRAWENFSEITPKKKGILQSIRVGTLPKARTLSNLWVGTETQDEITIHVVQVDARYSTFGNDINDVTSLVAELVSTIGAPEDEKDLCIIQEELMPMFFGKQNEVQEQSHVQAQTPRGLPHTPHTEAPQKCCLPWSRQRAAAAFGA